MARINNTKNHKHHHFKGQCQFQIMGRRCQLEDGICHGWHSLSNRYCEIHGREERINDCEYLTEIEDA